MCVCVCVCSCVCLMRVLRSTGGGLSRTWPSMFERKATAPYTSASDPLPAATAAVRQSPPGPCSTPVFPKLIFGLGASRRGAEEREDERRRRDTNEEKGGDEQRRRGEETRRNEREEETRSDERRAHLARALHHSQHRTRTFDSHRPSGCRPACSPIDRAHPACSPGPQINMSAS